MEQANVTRHGNAFRFSANPLQALHVGKIAADRLLDQDMHSRRQRCFRNRHVRTGVRRDDEGIGDLALNQFFHRAKNVWHTEFAGQSFRLRTGSIPQRHQPGFGKSAQGSGVQRSEGANAHDGNFDWLFHSDGVDLITDFTDRHG